MTLAIAGMSIGVIFNRKPLSGSCGGFEPNGECSICGGDTNKCENSNTNSPSI
ncbi:MAG: (Na+)-NQR maturation NqrM [Candidatus Neomarinimicrobiota bacterium]